MKTIKKVPAKQKLQLNRETIRVLSVDELKRVQAGMHVATETCPTGSVDPGVGSC
jgi:hypothetical protein